MTAEAKGRDLFIVDNMVNPDFKPIVLTGADEGQLQVVAEFVEVLGDGS